MSTKAGKRRKRSIRADSGRSRICTTPGPLPKCGSTSGGDLQTEEVGLGCDVKNSQRQIAVMRTCQRYLVSSFDAKDERLFDRTVEAPNKAIAQMMVLAQLYQDLATTPLADRNDKLVVRRQGEKKQRMIRPSLTKRRQQRTWPRGALASKGMLFVNWREVQHCSPSIVILPAMAFLVVFFGPTNRHSDVYVSISAPKFCNKYYLVETLCITLGMWNSATANGLGLKRHVEERSRSGQVHALIYGRPILNGGIG